MIFAIVTATEYDTKVILESCNWILIHLKAMQNKESPSWPITKRKIEKFLHFYCVNLKSIEEEVNKIINANNRNLNRFKANFYESR